MRVVWTGPGWARIDPQEEERRATWALGSGCVGEAVGGLCQPSRGLWVLAGPSKRGGQTVAMPLKLASGSRMPECALGSCVPAQGSDSHPVTQAQVLQAPSGGQQQPWGHVRAAP